MSNVQPLTPSLPALKAVQDPVDVLGDLVEAYLKAKGVPPGVSTELTETMEKAAKRVPSWVLYLLMFFGGPLMLFFWGQYQSYKDLPDRMLAIEQVQSTQGKQLDRIEDLLSPTSRPK